MSKRRPVAKNNVQVLTFPVRQLKPWYEVFGLGAKLSVIFKILPSVPFAVANMGKSVGNIS